MRFTEEQNIGALKEAEAGKKAEDICREKGISQWTFYQWRKKFRGMEASVAKRLRALEEENRKLKRIVADLTKDDVLKERMKELAAERPRWGQSMLCMRC